MSYFAEELGQPDFANLTGERAWFPGSLLGRFESALAEKRRPFLSKQAGEHLGAVIHRELTKQYEWNSIQEAIAYLPKVYTHLIRGDRAGIWIMEEIAPGFVRVRENTPFDCLFTEGLLSGLLRGLNARGGMVRHPSCRKESETERFCSYELIWMKNTRS